MVLKELMECTVLVFEMCREGCYLSFVTRKKKVTYGAGGNETQDLFCVGGKGSPEVSEGCKTDSGRTAAWTGSGGCWQKET